MTGAQAIVTVLLLLIMINICKYFERYGQFKAGLADKQKQLAYPLSHNYPSVTFILSYKRDYTKSSFRFYRNSFMKNVSR
jgi:hypothetical protein